MAEPEFRMPAGPPPLRNRVREVLIDLAFKIAAYGGFKGATYVLDRLLS